jgi:MraZ protein
MFIGEYTISMDEKGRIAVPVKFRQAFINGAFVTKGLDNNLSLYTREEWEKIAAKVATLPLTKANSRAFARSMLAGAFEFEIDKQGRGLLPEELRKFGNLNKKVVLAGVYDRIEIWDEQTWKNYKISTERDSAAIAESLGELGV